MSLEIARKRVKKASIKKLVEMFEKGRDPVLVTEAMIELGNRHSLSQRIAA